MTSTTSRISSFRIQRYNPEFEHRWNEFVANSRNATFLFNRAYMDYHADRFCDCSWLAYKNDTLIAILPANLTSDGVLHSHGGLTYGGWILPPAHLDGYDLLCIFTEACRVWKEENIKILDYKTLPYFYASRPSQEDEYALFRLGATLTECNISATIDLKNPGRPNQLQRRHLAKASKLPIEIVETRDIDAFMRLLADCLRDRHNIEPVHTSGEMRLLAGRFPDKIRFHAVMLDGEMHAAVCIYDTGLTAHAQYIATTAKGRELNLLTPLFHKLINEIYASRNYFDFGISTEDHGRYLNEGLLRQKYSYGATATLYRRYQLNL